MTQSQRYLALDVLRGITIAGMILVNTPGSWSYVYAPLRHASWHGCTPTDLVFPFFLFVVGVSMFFSFKKYGSTLNKKSLKKIGRRSLLIFAIGLFLNTFPQWKAELSSIRIMGVLQRIAIAYGIASIIVLRANTKGIITIGTLILFFYWGVLYLFGTGTPYDLETNTVLLVDRFILGESHLYKGFGIPFDPEGLLSTLPSIATVLIGYLTGVLIKNTTRDKLVLRMIIIGSALTLAGWIWGFVFPINKPIWTSSYVLFTGGLAMVLQSVLIWLIDIRGYKKWSDFFVVFGVNPLFIYALSGLWVRFLYMIKFTSADGETTNAYRGLYEGVFVPIAGNLNGSLLFAISHIIMFWLIGYILYKRKIFIKV